MIKAGFFLLLVILAFSVTMGQVQTSKSEETHADTYFGTESIPLSAIETCVTGTVNRFTGSYHSNLYIGNNNGVNVLLAWGQNMRTYTTGTGGDYTAPFFVNSSSYAGIPYEVRSSSSGGASGPSVMAIRTSTKLYVFGNTTNISDITSMTNFGAAALTNANADVTNKLPSGVGIADIAQFAVSPTAIAVVTNTGNVYMLTKLATLQGDNTVANPAIWHQVKLSNGIALSGVVKFSLSASGAFALTASGKIYYWGRPANVNASVNTLTSFNYAYDMSAQIPVGASVLELVVLGKDTGPNNLFLLCDNLKVYSCGLNDKGILGVGNASTTYNQATFQQVSGLSNIVHIDGNTEASLFTMGAMSSSGRIYGWGDGVACMLGIASQNSFTTNYINASPVDIFGVDGFTDFSISGHFTIAFYTNPVTAIDQYCYVGHNTGGSIGLPAINAAVISKAAIARLDAPAPISFNCSNCQPSVAIKDSLTAFNSCSGNASASQMMIVSGSRIIKNLSITAPVGFEISTTAESGYDSTAILTHSEGTVPATNIYIRLAAGAKGSVGGNLVFSSAGATLKNVSVNGIVNGLPLIDSLIGAARTGPGIVTVSGTVTPAIGTTIDWFPSSTGGSALNSGTLVYTTGILNTTTAFFAEAKDNNTGCVAAQRVPVIAIINASFSAGTIGSNQSICVGATATTLSSVTPASGGTGAIGYQWQFSLDNASFTDIPGERNLTYAPVGLKQTSFYRRLAKTVADGSIASNTITITVNALPEVSLPINNARTGVGAVVLSATASAGAILDWYATKTGGSILEGGAGVTNYTTAPIGVTTTYFAEAKNSVTGCLSENRIPVVATINSSFSSGSISTNQNLCLGFKADPLHSVTDASGGTGIISYQWQVSTISSAIGFIDIPFANDPNYTPGTIGQTSYFRRVASTIVDGNIFSNVVGIIIYPLPIEAIAINGSRTGAGVVNIGAVVAAGETTDWYPFSNGGAILNAGIGTTSFNTPYIDSTTLYYALARNTITGCIAPTRTLVQATIIIPTPVISVSGILKSFKACSGAVSEEQSFSVSAINLVGNLIINAPIGYELSTGSGAGFANAISLVPAAGSIATTTIFIRLVSTASNGITGNIQISSTNATTQKIATGVATVNPIPVFSPGIIAEINATATNFSIPFMASNANQFSISVGSRALPNFNALSNQSFSGTSLSIPVPASLPGQYDFNIVVRDAVTACVSAEIPIVLNIGKANAIISLDNITKNDGDPDFEINATSNSNGLFSYSIANLAIATIIGNTIHLHQVGNTTITVQQAASSNYFSASATATLIVRENAPKELSYSGPNIYSLLNPIAALTPSVSGTVTSYSISPGLPSGLNINNRTGVISGTPSQATEAIVYKVTASNTSGSISTTVSIAVNKLIPTISMNDIKKTFGAPDFAIDAISNSPGKINYTINNTSIATIIGNRVTLKSGGIATITASQEATDQFESAIVKAQLLVNELPKIGLEYPQINILTIDKTIQPIKPIEQGVFTEFSISPSLPTGLSIDSKTGYIIGKPIVLSRLTIYTVFATNGFARLQTTLNIQVNDMPPVFVYQPETDVANPRLSIKIATPKSTGGKVVNYSISPALPEGIQLEEKTGVITGKLISVKNGLQDYLITGVNSGGVATAKYTLLFNSAPSDIVLSNHQVLENLPSSSLIGLLRTTDKDDGDTHSYELISGIGSNDNVLFEIKNNVLVSKSSFNFEQKSDYQIRIQTTDEGGLVFEKSFHILVIDVNEVPTLAPMGDIRVYNLSSEQEIGLLNLSTGNDLNQSLEVQLSSSKINLFKTLKVVGNRILFSLKPDVFGNDVLIKVLVKDNGGVNNGGVDTLVRAFVLGIDPLPKVTATPTQITPGKTSQLQVEAAHAIEYRWNNINAIVGSTDISNPVIRPIPNDIFIVTVKNKWGYTAEGSVSVIVDIDYSLEPKNILTPNADGHNDRWIIANIECYPNSEVAVYDKSGKLVFKEKGYKNLWDGKINGVALKDDTYFYIIQFNKPNVKPIKGYLTILH